MSCEPHGCHLRVSDGDPARIAASIDLRADTQSRPTMRGTNQVHDGRHRVALGLNDRAKRHCAVPELLNLTADLFGPQWTFELLWPGLHMRITTRKGLAQYL